MAKIPTQLRSGDLTQILDQIRKDYAQLSRSGQIDGLMIADQDAKVLAVNTFFEDRINYWDIGVIGAALYGVSKQGKDFFRSTEIDRTMICYQDTQFFVQRIGDIDLDNGRQRELLLIVIGNRALNIGLVILQMQKYAAKIRTRVEEDATLKDHLQMSETQFNDHLLEIKKELFQLAK